MVNSWIIVLLVLAAFAIALVLYPFILRFAIRHEIFDNPGYRKLQRVPVPVMGGLTIFSGLCISGIIAFFIFKDVRLLWVCGFLLVMLAVGMWDDIKDLSAYIKFAMEIVVVWSIMFFMDIHIDDFHGLWGVYKISEVLSVAISLVAGVGIINAINLIDGVDGYCSFYGMMACTAFGITFFLAGDTAMGALCFIMVGALIPFFVHNVFGVTSKMFLGDGGSLVLGTMLTICLFAMLSSGSQCVVLDWSGISLVALALAILAVPVFDTLRVMTVRVIHGRSPFSPDKTHLHHLFIDLSFSHAGTSISIVTGNFLIVLLELVLWKAGVSPTWQVYTVAAAGILLTCVFYYILVIEGRKNNGEGSSLYKRFCGVGLKTHIHHTSFWKTFHWIADRVLSVNGRQKDADEVRPLNYTRPDPRIPL
jgi:UDP-N-acetylmuramyl pentapeptide phosphotransferase/UDP-N-acetylglucosamine-1-phosphate transferase